MEKWQRTVENYTVGVLIAIVQLERARRQQEREALHAKQEQQYINRKGECFS
jgi:hypothetical protein